MTRRIDMTGRRFGRVTVLEFAGVTEQSRNARWKCRCDCGTVFVTTGDALRRGSCRSCGCLRSESCRRRHAEALGAWRVPVKVTTPDGIRHLFASQTEAAGWLGCTPATVFRHIFKGTSFRGCSFERLKPARP